MFNLSVITLAILGKDGSVFGPAFLPPLSAALNQALAHVSVEHLNLLCRIHANFNGVLVRKVHELLEERIRGLLMATAANEISLSAESLQWLKHQADCGKNLTLRVAALVTLKERQMEGLPELALRASQSENDRV